MEYAHERARSYIAKATDALEPVPAGQAKDALIQTAHFMAHRAA